MRKSVWATAIRLDKSEPLLVVEPFDGTVRFIQHIVRHAKTPFFDQVAAISSDYFGADFFNVNVNTLYYVLFLKNFFEAR